VTLTSSTPDDTFEPVSGRSRPGVSRRGFLGYVVGASTLVVAVDLGSTTPAYAAVPSPPQIAEAYDLEDAQTDAARPTAQLITITVNEDGTASFALPRMEVGQGITTSTAMIIAEELDLPVEKVHVTLAPARPELMLNQLTGGSNTTVSTYTPIRVAAAIAKGALLDAAAIELGSAVALLKSKNGVVTAPDGSSTTYGALATKAASPTTRKVDVELKGRSSFAVIGTPQNRVDAHDIVTGKKKFAMDLEVPDALPTMVCRAPTLNGTPEKLRNEAAVLAMPGVTDVALIATGIAVRAQTFGQCIDAIRAMDVQWNPGTV
jgi:isoquinoline 1-oxidoreductase beta subunit